MPGDETVGDLTAATEALLAAAKAEAEAQLLAIAMEAISDVSQAKAGIARVTADLENVWRLKLAGKDTTAEEKWLEKEARLVSARLGLKAAVGAERAFIVTANILIGLGSALLSAFLKVPIQFPPIGGGVA